MERSITSSISAVQKWVESHEYKGYDPGDGLTSFLRPLTFGNLFAERILVQLIWKSPFNLRPLLGVAPMESTKGRGFMAWGYLLRHKTSGNPESLDKALECLHWLEQNNEKGHVGHAWGNHFDFTTRGGRMKAHTPTVVWSSLIGQAFIQAFATTGDAHFMDIAESICDWILKLPREQTESGTCISYTPTSQNSVHNSNLLGAGMLAATWKNRPKEIYRDSAREAVRYSCARQRFDGSWWYGERQKHHWIDNFHTAYNLDSIKRYIDNTGDETFRQNLVRGYNYFKNTFFEESGRPRYYNTSTFPVDIQCAAQAIDTFCHFANEDEEALPMARKVARWTINRMQSPDGHFCYREYPMLIARTPYFHWGQSTMFKALSHLELVESEALKRLQGKTGRANQLNENITGSTSRLSYALVTPARNEEALIERTIQSVVAQTVLPVKWVVVSDGSTDRTDEIVKSYAATHPWIELQRMPERSDRQFAAKAQAFNAGYERISHLPFNIIGNLDADITFDSGYFEFLLSKFESNPQLGVAGTPFVEDHANLGKHTYAHQFSQVEHVSGACQLFRRACFESIGGYKPVVGGAIDWIAVTTARMRGWKTRTFTEKVCLHHRAIGTANNRPLMARFHYGTKAYFVGSHPAWALIRGVFQMRQKPLFLGGLFFGLGYIWAFLKRTPRVVTPELMAFYRAEQMARMRELIPRRTKRA